MECGLHYFEYPFYLSLGFNPKASMNIYSGQATRQTLQVA